MFFLERSGFFAALLDNRLSSNSLCLTVRADAFTPACCHSWASSALVVTQSCSWINFRRRSWRLLDYLGLPEAFFTNAVEIFLGGLSSFSWQPGNLQLIAIHLITLHNIHECIWIAIIKNEAVDFVKINICVILKTFGHGCKGSVVIWPFGIQNFKIFCLALKPLSWLANKWSHLSPYVQNMDLLF